MCYNLEVWDGKTLPWKCALQCHLVVILSIWTAHVKDWLVYGLLLGLVILHKGESDGLFDHSATGIEAPVI